MSSDESKKIIEELSHTISFSGPSDFPKIIRLAMELVEKQHDMKGPEKRQLVIDVVTFIVDKSDVCDVLLPMIPSIIDEFIDINDGKMEVDKKFKGSFFEKVFKCCY